MPVQLLEVSRALSARSLQSNVPLLRASPPGVQCQPVSTDTKMSVKFEGAKIFKVMSEYVTSQC